MPVVSAQRRSTDASLPSKVAKDRRIFALL